MGADEEGTHERLKAHHRQLVEPKTREHRGRIVKTTGDGMLVEFPSVVDAVRCAAEVQRGMIDREPQLPNEQRIKFRIGINLGDVIADGSDIFGDGVNVAARLEALAEPGGICVSGVVRDQIRDRLPYEFEDLGEQNVKNIARPVRVHALGPGAIADLPASSMPISASRRRHGRGISIVAATAAVLALGVGAWWLWPTTKHSSAPEVATATSISQPFVAPRLSIVVLPFANLSNNPERQYFADGITEDVTTDLSRIPNMFVIARGTAFSYRGKPADPKQIGRELGVRYLLEGSVQTLGTRLRITAQLIDGETNAHLWAERFDRDAADLYTLQNEITGRIAAALHLELLAAEAARPTADPDALDYILRGVAALRKPATRDGYAETIGLFEHALALDPRSAEAQSRLADVLSARVMAGWASSSGADLARAEGLAGQAMTASPRTPMAHFAKAQVLRAQRRYAEAIPEYETALTLNRNIVAGWHALAQCKLFTGSIEETIPLEEQAIRLSPRDPFLHLFYSEIGFVHLLQSRTDEAILWLEKARNANPEHPGPHIRLAAAYGLEGEPERSAAELAEARRLAVAGTFSSIAKMKAGIPSSVPPTSRALFDTTFFAGLRKAGMPEE